MADTPSPVDRQPVDLEYMIDGDSYNDFVDEGLFSDKKGLGQSSGQEILKDWTPIQATIGINNSLTYTFPVDYSSPGLSSSYQIMVFISAAICQVPKTWDQNSPTNGLSLYYTFNQDITNISAMGKLEFANGYTEGIATTPITGNNTDLYITVKPDECEHCTLNDTWTYQLGLSQSDLVFQYDNNAMVSVVDTDYDSVAFSAYNLTFANDSNYKLYLYNRTEYASLSILNESWCAVTNAEHDVMEFALNESAVVSDKKFFSVDNLLKSQDYTGVLVRSYDTAEYGGSVFHLFNFSTMGSEACKVIYGLEFCNEVSYAVPVSRNFSNDMQDVVALGKVYDQHVKDLFTQFEYALEQTACDAHLDSRYSPIRTCDDCRYSYKQWLCAISIPRCSSENGSYYKEYESSDGRNDFIREVIDPPLPYYEILPCIDTCDAIVRDCPADFKFACPTRSDFVGISYGLPDGDTENGAVSCNMVGDKSYNTNDGMISTSGGSKLQVSTPLIVFALSTILYYTI